MRSILVLLLGTIAYAQVTVPERVDLKSIKLVTANSPSDVVWVWFPTASLELIPYPDGRAAVIGANVSSGTVELYAVGVVDGKPVKSNKCTVTIGAGPTPPPPDPIVDDFERELIALYRKNPDSQMLDLLIEWYKSASKLTRNYDVTTGAELYKILEASAAEDLPPNRLKEMREVIGAYLKPKLSPVPTELTEEVRSKWSLEFMNVANYLRRVGGR